MRDLIKRLQRAYPDAHCELNFNNEFELLISVILSAQCTDKRVNAVTKELFKNYNTPQSILALGGEALGEYIKPCGFFRVKSKNIINCCQSLINLYGGKVPRDFESLTALSGVGRKTANVMLSVAFGIPALAVDTHVFRVSHRLGLSNGNTPEKVEKDLVAIFNNEDISLLHHLLIFHGRYCCKAKNPDCKNCSLAEDCPYYKSTEEINDKNIK